jgi:hypothetical protein
MVITLIILAAIFLGALGLHGFKQFKVRQERRISQNEYDAAVALWEFARLIKTSIAEAVQAGSFVLNFANITIPHSVGYKVSLELIGTYFRVYAIPDRYGRSGRLSFLADNTLTVRAADHAGSQATPEDAEYKGEALA